jgi:hypothetical protein
MKITKKTITVRELTENYSDDGDNGVYGFNGKLCIRPEYQRSFVYSDKQRNMVLDTVRKGFPLGLMYWNLKPDGNYECLDGQQRTISIAQYVNSDFAIKVNGNDKFFHNLTETEKDDILNYELEIRVCEGTEEEKLEWFKVINIAGETLTNQELLNATYTGTWLADAKNYFSKRNCVAKQMAEGYVKGNPIRQDYLEKVLSWVADRDNLKSGQIYMAIHQHDEDANDLWLYYQSVINWAKMMFPKVRKGITDVQEWGILYNKYHDNKYNTNTLEAEIQKLILDDDVTKNSGIIPYILSPRTKFDEKSLSIRAFTLAQKMRVYEKQEHKCPFCIAEGINTEYTFEEMQGDHIVPWSKGGRTVEENLQMLCTRCNNDKSNR